MNAITAISAPTAAGIAATGTILAREGDAWLLGSAGEEMLARRAFSCLVEPTPGDVVLLGGDAARPFILAILERPGGAPMRLDLPDGATLGAEDGRLNIAAGTLVMEAATGQVAIGTLAVNAARVDGRVGRLGLVAEAIETIAERIIGRFRRSYRFVEESDHLRARDIDQRASGHLGLKGDTAAIQAGAVVKVNANQVHIG